MGDWNSRNEAESGWSRSAREVGGKGNGNKPPSGLKSVAVLIEYIDAEEALLCGIMGVSDGGRTTIWGGGDMYEITEAGKDCGRWGGGVLIFGVEGERIAPGARSFRTGAFDGGSITVCWAAGEDTAVEDWDMETVLSVS